MKLEELEITDFRGIDHLKLDFRDELGRVRSRLAIVGPNTSGKTTILDAIALCLTLLTDAGRARGNLALTPSALVRRGAAQARITGTVRFSQDELLATAELLGRVGVSARSDLVRSEEVKVHWEYPGQHKGRRWGEHRCEPEGARALFEARATVARSLHIAGVGPRLYEDLGGVFLFDQDRAASEALPIGGDRPIATEGLRESTPAGDLSLANGVNGTRAVHGGSRLRNALVTLAARAQAAQAPDATENGDFSRLRHLFDHVCRPDTMRGLYNTEAGLDVEFIGERGPYLFDGLSGGQQVVLQLLLQFATRHIHRSIVLIDELELHLDPLWQDRLYYGLGDLGVDNQFFVTTHSLHLRDKMCPDEVRNMESRGEMAAVGEGAE